MTIRRSTQDLDLGFGIYDSERVDQYRNRSKVQILTPTPTLPPEERTHYCSKCNKKIEWLERPGKFICYICGLSYHELYDTPLSSIDQQIKPIQSNDPNERQTPVFISIKRDTRLQGENKYANGIQDIRISGNGRIVKIKTNNLAAASEENIRKYLKEDATYGL